MPLRWPTVYARRAAVLPHPLAAVAVEQGPGLGHPPGTLTQGIAIVAARHEADLLAFGLLGSHETQSAGDLSDLRLGQLAEREPRVIELVLAQPVQEVGLVLVRVTRAQQPRSPVRTHIACARNDPSRPPRSRTDDVLARAAPRT